ncbi:MAG: alpha/beta hydrolase [Pirellulaceae bacterium]|nr:alpha/beta hydrolase [Pirellulaceae bacterium]
MTTDAGTDRSVPAIYTVRPYNENPVVEELGACDPNDASSCPKLWVVSTRHVPSNVCRANLTNPALSVSRLTDCGCVIPSSLDEYFSNMVQQRPTVFYVHGNRMASADAIRRGLKVYRRAQPYLQDRTIDWVIFSWPSAKEGCLVGDVKRKADRIDAQGLYLAWLLRNHIQHQNPIAMIGYSFGARVITGSLHAMAGGALGGRRLRDAHVTGADISVGFVAPAVDASWTMSNRYHGRASQNLRCMSLLYNSRDIALKQFWRLNGERGSVALGSSGMPRLGLRLDGTAVPARSIDCSSIVGFHHNESFYYQNDCTASREMARMINQHFCCDVTESKPSH